MSTRVLQNSAVQLLVLLENEFVDMLRGIITSTSLSDTGISDLEVTEILRYLILN